MFTGMRSITTLPHKLKLGINFPIRFRETRGAQFKLSCAPKLFSPHPQFKAFDDEARNGRIVLGSEGRDLGLLLIGDPESDAFALLAGAG